MLTFNLESGSTGNYYRGHEPANGSSNCWSDRKHAMVFDLEQARKLVKARRGSVNIVVAVSDRFPVSPAEFGRELFCVNGGDWFLFPHRMRLGLMKQCKHYQLGGRCKLCGAILHSPGNYWYDSVTGTTIDEKLVI